jgi:MPBQ/MSBQ methyltransferase
MSTTKETVDLLNSGGKNLELLIVTDVMGLRSLHYGYWDQIKEITLGNVKKAQERYTETLVDMVPTGVKSVLDIGCGIGDNAEAIAKKGCKVTAVSPDVNHKKYFDKFQNPNIIFVQTSLENFQPENFQTDQRFDLMLFSESQTYFDPEISFKRSQTLLNPNGYILLSDMFTKRKGNHTRIDFTEEDYLAHAQEYGFKVIESVDITKHILPTIELVDSFYSTYLNPTIKVMDDYLRNTAPIKYRLVKLFFGPQINNLKKIKEHFDRRFDPGFFENEVTYKRLLLQKTSSAL